MWVKKWAADYVRENLEIPGCRAFLRLDKEVRRRGELLSYATRSYVSRLSPDEISAASFQKIIQGHWGVENGLADPRQTAKRLGLLRET